MVFDDLSMRLSLSHPVGLIRVFGFFLRLSCAAEHSSTSRSWREQVEVLFHEDAGATPARAELLSGEVMS